MQGVSGKILYGNFSAPLKGENISGTNIEVPNEQIKATVKQEKVELAHHVSLQIFSCGVTDKNKEVIVFLHGGPGLEYNEDFEHVTSWCMEHGYTLVAPEIAGSSAPGLENKSNSCTPTPNYVRDLQSVIQYLSQREDFQGKEFCAVGHSWGGTQLASLLADSCTSLEDKTFFKQVLFISSSLDTGQTRFFASPFTHPPYINQINEVIGDSKERHAGIDATDAVDTIDVVNNPVINQTLNERFSLFYRLEQMPLNIPYLFFHATDDTQVPASLSVDSFAKINNAGGNAKIVISTHGNHGFFKTGELHQADVMATCFGAIDNLVKQPDLLTRATLDGVYLDDLAAGKLENKIVKWIKTIKIIKICWRSFIKKRV